FAYSGDSYTPSTVCSPLPKTPTGPADGFKCAAEVAGAPMATPPAIYQTHVVPAAAPGPPAGMAEVAQGPSLPSPPRDHVAPKAYESARTPARSSSPYSLQLIRISSAVLQGCSASPIDEGNLLVWAASLCGPDNTEWEGGIFSLRFTFTDRYPDKPPRVRFSCDMFHPVAREIRLHADLCHDSIIAMYAAWKDRAYVYLALEWAPGGDVYSYLKSQRGRLAEELAVPLILEPFMAGLSVIHEQGLIHRDIKPENILLNNSFQVKIADFGLSIDSKQEIANTRLGTIDYLAPEILDCPVKQHPDDHKDRPDTGYTNKVDCWSVGVLAYELLVGQPPFAAPTAQETLRLIRTKKVEYPAWLSPESVNFMSSVLVRDPVPRPTIAELLQHPWILKYSRREGGGLDRNRNRLLTRRPTVDGGVLVRSNTHTDLTAMVAAKPPQLQVPGGGSGAGPATGMYAHNPHPHPTALQHSQTYGHGHQMPHGNDNSNTNGMGNGSGTNYTSQPLPAIHGQPGSVAAAAANAYDSAAPSAAAYGDASNGAAAMYGVPLPGGGGGMQQAAASPTGGPEKSVGSLSRKLKFWSVATAGGPGSPNGPNSGGAAAENASLSSPTGRVSPLPPVTPAAPASAAPSSPSLFARLTSARSRAAAAAGGMPQPPSPPATATAHLSAPGSPRGGRRPGPLLSEAGAAYGKVQPGEGSFIAGNGGAGISVHGGSVYGGSISVQGGAMYGSGAVPPLEAPSSPSGMQRFAKGSGLVVRT
ncbi:Aurora kinase C, partial [Tetrabaena socialis]